MIVCCSVVFIDLFLVATVSMQDDSDDSMDWGSSSDESSSSDDDDAENPALKFLKKA